jgi:hypothetical protein
MVSLTVIKNLSLFRTMHILQQDKKENIARDGENVTTLISFDTRVIYDKSINIY